MKTSDLSFRLSGFALLLGVATSTAWARDGLSFFALSMDGDRPRIESDLIGDRLHIVFTGGDTSTLTVEQSRDLIHWIPMRTEFRELGVMEFDEPADWGRGDRFYRGRAGQPAEVSTMEYHGWAGSLVLNNGIVEAVVVPKIGRLMQFRFAGEEDGPFWENRSLDGQTTDPESSTWQNYGGDKAWPAPQADFPIVGDRSWPPPRAFDSMMAEAEESNGMVTLTSPVDPYYGIRTIRRIQLVPGANSMVVSTTFERVQAPTKEDRPVGVWVVTQLGDPELMNAPVPEDTAFGTRGLINLGSSNPFILARNVNGLIRFTRSDASSYKIGMDGDSLMWMDEEVVVRMDSPRVPGEEYADGGCSTEIYTNPSPAYVELEMLGPLHDVAVGETIERIVVYTLYRRQESDPMVEARKLFGLHPDA